MVDLDPYKSLASEMVSVAYFDLLTWKKFKSIKPKRRRKNGVLDNHVTAVHFFNEFSGSVWNDLLGLPPDSVKKAVVMKLSGNMGTPEKINHQFRMSKPRSSRARKRVHVGSG